MIFFKSKTGSPYVDRFGAEHPDAIIVDTNIDNDRQRKIVRVYFEIYHNYDAMNSRKEPLSKFHFVVSESTGAYSLKEIVGSIPTAYEEIIGDETTDWSLFTKVGFPQYAQFWNFVSLTENGLIEAQANGLEWVLHYNGTNIVTNDPNLSIPLVNDWEIYEPIV